MKKICLQFEPLGKIFYVVNSLIKQCIDEGEIPQLMLPDDAYKILGCPLPADDAPVIGLLMGRSGDCYSSDLNYVLALAKTGVRIRFLTYYHCVIQLEECDGLLLPGGSFESSELYYVDPHDDQECKSVRQMAYIVCIRSARQCQKPILGICAGAQMVAAEFGLKLYRNFEHVETPIKHQTKDPEAHRLNVFADTPLQRMFGDENLFYVNSRHSELLAPLKIQRELWHAKFKGDPDTLQLPLDFYAEANDGTPEAWGSEKEHILCVQWHPEDMAAAGDAKMQALFQWLADIAKKTDL